MTDTLTTVLISSIVSLVGSFLVVYVAAKRAPAQIDLDRSSAADMNSKAAIALNDGLIKRVERLEAELAEACEALEAEKEARQASDRLAADKDQRLKALEVSFNLMQTQVDELRQQRDSYQIESKQYKQERDLFENWAQRLVGQIKSIDPDTVPVPVNSGKKK